MLRYAAEGLLIRAGEAVDRIDKAPSTFVDDHPELELRKLKDARNVTAHGFDIVDAVIVWAILSTHVPVVTARVRGVLAQP